MNQWVYEVGVMICGVMGAIMYDFMLFALMCGLTERLATLKGSRPLEVNQQDTCGEPSTSTPRSYTPAAQPGEARASQNASFLVAWSPSWHGHGHHGGGLPDHAADHLHLLCDGRTDAWVPLPWPLASVTVANPMMMFHNGAEINPDRSITTALFQEEFHEQLDSEDVLASSATGNILEESVLAPAQTSSARSSTQILVIHAVWIFWSCAKWKRKTEVESNIMAEYKESHRLFMLQSLEEAERDRRRRDTTRTCWHTRKSCTMTRHDSSSQQWST
ncbi:uncharacterized protein LOC134438761 [Engraulis encrasicolus]|uniref:uncharacterized protein LOC134438761 n=1 Tax=Engraulis encrasicolus TaxID=184585 RepID=UPI002FCF6605